MSYVKMHWYLTTELPGIMEEDSGTMHNVWIKTKYAYMQIQGVSYLFLWAGVGPMIMHLSAGQAAFIIMSLLSNWYSFVK